jgi:hypothetical protein
MIDQSEGTAAATAEEKELKKLFEFKAYHFSQL